MYNVSLFNVTELPIQGAPGTLGEVYNEGLCGGVASNRCCNFKFKKVKS